MDQKCTNDTRFYYNKDLNENLKAALLPPTHTVRKVLSPPPSLIKGGWGVQLCQCNVFIFKNKKQTGYDINIAK